MSSPFRFTHAEDSPGFLLWQVTNLWQRQVRAALQPLGLTHVQFVLLASLLWLQQHAEHITQVQLAEHARSDVMMTSKVVRALEAKGWLTRSIHPHDSRAHTLRLTAAGSTIAKQAVPVVEAVDAAFFGADSHVSAALVEHMQRLIAHAQSDSM